MKIYVNKTDLKKPINIDIPNTLMLNKLTSHWISDNQTNLSKENTSRLIQEMKYCIEQFGHFNFIHVETEDGTIVKIDF